jgi:Family of unknown function (DUF5689)
MKKLLLLLGFISLIFSEKVNSQTLIAGWDFQTAPGTVVLPSASGTPKLYNSNVGSGILYLDGTNNSSLWASTELDGFGGSGLNAGGTTGLSTVTSGASCLALVNSSANGKIAVFKVNMSGYQNLIISYATRNTSTGFSSQVWEYSTNGTNWSAIGTITGLTTTFAVKSLASTSGLDNINNAFVRLTVSGATNATGNNRLDNIQFNATLIPVPTLTATPTTIPAFNYVFGNGPSTSNSYNLSGSNLSPTADTVKIFAPTNFEISKTAGSGFKDSLNILYSSGSFNLTPIYARLKAGLPISNAYGDTIRHSGGGVNITAGPKIRVSGSVTSVPPPVITTTGTLSTFYTIVGTPSASQSYTVSGNDLVTDITITAPTDFEIKTGAGAYANTIMLTPTSGNVPTTTIDVRLKGTNQGNFTGQNITNVSTTASASIAVNGTVGASCGVATDISTVRALVPPVASNTGGTTFYTVTGTITGVFGANKFYVQDATGGIAVFSTAVVTLNNLAVGDQVTLSGIPVRFNGEAQLNGSILTVTPLVRNPIPCITKISTGMAPAPIVFNANTPPSGIDLNTFLASNEGSFIKIISANIPSVGTFVTSTNYTVISCNAQGGTEIRVDAGSTTLIGSTIPTTTQDITAVVGRFINATGTDKLQIFPRSASDLSNSATTCTVSGGCGVTTFTDSPTQLDVFNWNIEWIGHPTNGPSQSGTNDATQIANARTVLNSVGADIYMLQEICQYNPANPSDNTTSFGKLIEGLNTTFGANTYSGECSAAVSGSNPDPNPQRVCIIYKNSVVTKVFSRPMFDGFTPATYPPTGTPSQFWASGRKPFMFMAKVNINSQSDTILFVGLHAKAGSAIEDYDRRKFDVRAMYDTLQAQYPTRKTIVLGDINDDVDKSIASNATNGQLISTYAPFLYANPNETAIAGTRPNADWNAISKTLSDAFCASTATFSDYIDHQIISNEMSGTTSAGFKYVPATVTSFRPVVSNYASTTSDHYPTIARFQYFTLPITSIATGNWSSPTTWDCNCVPTATDNVVIDTPHTVTVDAASQAKTINLKGILNYLAPFVLTLGQ